jgi:hypothetical protein
MSSFYISINTPDVQREYKHVLKTELVLPEHENWLVGLAHMSVFDAAKPPPAQYVKYWISERHVLTKSPNFVLTAVSMRNKEYYILVNNTHKVELPHGNYTWANFVETLVFNFNKINSRERVDLSMEFKYGGKKLVLQKVEKTPQLITIKFSTDLATFLKLYVEEVPFPKATLTIMLPFTVPNFITGNVDESRTTAEGVMRLNPVLGVHKFTIATTKLPEKTTTSLTCIIPPGIWPFTLLQQYINDFLKQANVSVKFPINYEYSSKGIFVSHFYYGKMQFSNIERDGVETAMDMSYHTITFDGIFGGQMNISPLQLTLQVRSTNHVECEYRVTMAKSDPIMQEYCIQQPVSYKSLNAPQQVFVFQLRRIVLVQPPNKHEYTEYMLMLDEPLNKLLGVAEHDDHTQWLYFDYAKVHNCNNIIENVQPQQHEETNMICSVFTDIIVDNEMMSTLEDGKYQLLRHVYCPVQSSIIYPIMYFKINRHRISVINIKCTGIKGKASMVLHFKST